MGHEITTDDLPRVSVHLDASHGDPDSLPALLAGARARATQAGGMTLGDLLGVLYVGVLALIAYALLGMGMPW